MAISGEDRLLHVGLPMIRRDTRGSDLSEVSVSLSWTLTASNSLKLSLRQKEKASLLSSLSIFKESVESFSLRKVNR